MCENVVFLKLYHISKKNRANEFGKAQNLLNVILNLNTF